MRIINIIRAIIAGVVGFSILGTFGLVTLFLAPIYRLLMNLINGTSYRNPFQLIVKLCAWCIHHIALRGLMGMKIEIEGDVMAIRNNEFVVCIANHPSVPTIPVLFWYITHYVVSRVLAVGKKEHLQIRNGAPFMGWPMVVAQVGVFIDRADPLSAFRSIRNSLKNLLTGVVGFVILPDGHRAFPIRVLKDRNSWAQKHPCSEPWLYETCLPKAGGFLSTLQGIDELRTSGQKIRIVNISIGSDRVDHSIMQLPDMIGATVYLKVQEEDGDTVPRDRPGIEKWLVKRWKIKNLWLSANK